MKKWRVFFVIFALVLAAPRAPADQVFEFLHRISNGLGLDEATGLRTFPTLLISMGGESEAMGTAYTAVGRDLSFLDGNPAASASLVNTEAAFYHTNLIADTSMEGFAYTIRQDDLGLGFAAKMLHVPFTHYDAYGYNIGSFRYSESVVGVNAAYNFLRGFYFSGVSVGANAKLAYRYIPDSIYPDQSAVAVMADIGALTRFDFLKLYSARERNTAVGVTVRNVGPPVGGDPVPTVLTVGLAYSPFRPVLVAFDYNVPLSLFTDHEREMPGFAIGTRVRVTDFITSQAGFLWRGNNPRFSLGTIIDLQPVRLAVNYTLDMTTQLNRFDRFSVQAGFAFGDRGRRAVEKQVEELYLDALVAFAEGNIELTIELAEKALELDPRFQPAAETRDTAKTMLSLQERMDTLRIDDSLAPEDEL